MFQRKAEFIFTGASKQNPNLVIDLTHDDTEHNILCFAPFKSGFRFEDSKIIDVDENEPPVMSQKDWIGDFSDDDLRDSNLREIGAAEFSFSLRPKHFQQEDPEMS